MNKTRTEHLEDIRARFVSQACWGVSAGSPRGYSFILNLGGKNQGGHISPARIDEDDPDEIRGEFEIFVTCKWSLYQHGKLITDCSEENSIDGPMVRGLKQLVGEHVVSVIRHDKTFIFDFTSDYLLICDMGSHKDETFHTVMFFNIDGSYGTSKDGNISFIAR